MFFGADFAGGADLQSSVNGFSAAELENKSIKMERELSLKNPVEHVDSTD